MKEWLNKTDSGGPQPDSIEYVNSAEINSVGNELNNAVLNSGQTLAEGDDNQLSKMAANQAALSELLIDSGSTNDYNLTPQNGSYVASGLIDGMRFRFTPGNDCTGPSIIRYAGTVKNSVGQDGFGLNPGEISSNRECLIEWNESSNLWIVKNSGEEWRDLILQNGWVNFGGSYIGAQYNKVGNRVYLRGLIKSGTTTSLTVIGTTGLGFRTIAGDQTLGSVSNLGACVFDVITSGDIIISSVLPGNTYLSLNNMSFEI